MRLFERVTVEEAFKDGPQKNGFRRTEAHDVESD